MVLVNILANQLLISNTGDSSASLGMTKHLYPLVARGRNILLRTLTHKRITNFRRDAMHRVSTKIQKGNNMNKATNVVWHNYEVNKQKRAEAKKQKPMIIWFTGLSGSGKSTIADALEKKLFADGYHTYLLDGDNIRHGINKNLGFSDEDRTENIRRIGEISKLFVDAGLIVITAFISPFQSDRDTVRRLVDDGEFIEVFVDTPLEVCEERDPKGMYKKARAGIIKQFTGIDSPYEAPVEPEVVCKTDQDINKTVQILATELLEKGYL